MDFARSALGTRRSEIGLRVQGEVDWKLPLGAALEPGENGMLTVRAPVLRQHRLIENGVGNGADERAQVEAAKPAFHGYVWLVYVCCSFVKSQRRFDRCNPG